MVAEKNMSANPKDLLPKVERMCGVFLSKCKKAGYELRITHTYRSTAEQNALYAQGRTTPGARVTNARGGDSLHNYRVAFDVVFIKGLKAWYPPASSPLWQEIGKIAQSIGLEHGDRGFVDLPHFQYRAGYSLEDFKKKRIDIKKFQ